MGGRLSTNVTLSLSSPSSPSTLTSWPLPITANVLVLLLLLLLLFLLFRNESVFSSPPSLALSAHAAVLEGPRDFGTCVIVDALVAVMLLLLLLLLS